MGGSPRRLFWGRPSGADGAPEAIRGGACPNLPQRRSGPGSAVSGGAEYQRFFSRAPARSGPLWQIWTAGAAAGPVGRAVARLGEVHDVDTGLGTRAEGGRGSDGRPVLTVFIIKSYFLVWLFFLIFVMFM